MEANTEVEKSTPTEAPQVSESEKSKRGGKAGEEVEKEGDYYQHSFIQLEYGVTTGLYIFHPTFVSQNQIQSNVNKKTVPRIVDDYNKHMGDVDQADRLLRTYCINRRSKKWWHCPFFAIVDIAFVNSYILYKKLNPEGHLTLLDLRRGVALGLMNQTNSPATKKSHISLKWKITLPLKLLRFRNQRKAKEEERQKRKWKKRAITTNIPSYSMDENPIEEHFQHCSTYTDYFLTVLGPNIVEYIVYHSNLYATQRGKAMNFEEHELLAFLGLNYFMGYHTVPSCTHYWSCAEDLGIAIVKRVMPRSRLEQLLQYLHINDHSTLPPNNKDKIHKIRPFVITLNERFDILNNGTRKLAVDESMIIFEGRSTLKQYNPKKPIKLGYKLWCLGDQNGYIKKFAVFQGKMK
ncbi:hypothetical protein JTB14_015179 [Gonioctena quinquepunctata]|nr:hypothetical protein JTB14_015179 [Gonioctena quinquepunctata]